MNVRHVGIGVLVVALIAWALYMALTVAAYAHTLPMSEVGVYTGGGPIIA